MRHLRGARKTSDDVASASPALSEASPPGMAPPDSQDDSWMLPPLKSWDSPPFEVRLRVNMSRINAVSTVAGNAFVKIGVVFYWRDDRLTSWDQFQPLPPKLWGPYLVLEVNPP